MNFIALKMLTGDRAKYLGLIFAIAFCTFLLENQTSISRAIAEVLVYPAAVCLCSSSSRQCSPTELIGRART
jgi:hypothetical protein